MNLNRININAYAVVNETTFDKASLYSLADSQVHQVWEGPVDSWEQLGQLVHDTENADYVILTDTVTRREYGLSRAQLDSAATRT